MTTNSKWQIIKPVLILNLSILVLMVLASIWVWQQLPADARLPVHWNISGEVDRFGSKFEGLFLVPLVTLGMMALLMLVPVIEPRRQHIWRSMKAYRAILIAIILLMAFLHFVLLTAALGQTVNVGRLVTLGVGILFILIGNYLGKVRSNFFLGIRTPWTLSSERAWNKTHRLGGWLYVILGFIIVMNGIFWGATRAFIVLISGAILFSIIPAVYSYFVWKSDPDKQTRGT